MKIENPILRGAILAVSVSAMALAVLKAQGCQSSQADVDDPPAAVAPVEQPAPVPATNNAGDDPSAAHPSAPGADAGSPDTGEAPAKSPPILPATKSGAFFRHDPPQQAPPVQQQANQAPE